MSLSPPPVRIPWERADDLGLARLELAQDPLAARLRPDQRDRLARQALAAGEDAARALLERLPGHSPRQVAAALGVIPVVDLEPPAPAFPVRALYERDEAGRAVITLNEPLIAETVRRVGPYLAFPPDFDQVSQATLAHELFHHLEETERGDLSDQLEPVTLWRFGPWQRSRPVRRLREVGAHAFARRLLGLPCLPNLWDYLVLVDRGQMSPDQLWSLVGPASPTPPQAR